MPDRRNICIIGSKGMLGGELLDLCGNAQGFDLPELDITDEAQTHAVLAGLRPAVVINAAAFTDVDGCETREAEASAVNVDAVAHLARACRGLGAKLLHVSTDYVFDGRARDAYCPDGPIAPINAYGRTKALGEAAIREIWANHVIVRTSWLFGRRGKNFVKTILRLAGEREELQVVHDQQGRPTYATDLADVLIRFADSLSTGTYHFANAGVCTWYDFACEIVRQAGKPCRVRPTTSEAFPRPAKRPAWSVLDTSTTSEALGIDPRPWQAGLRDCLAGISDGNASGSG